MKPLPTSFDCKQPSKVVLNDEFNNGSSSNSRASTRFEGLEDYTSSISNWGNFFAPIEHSPFSNLTILLELGLFPNKELPDKTELKELFSSSSPSFMSAFLFPSTRVSDLWLVSTSSAEVPCAFGVLPPILQFTLGITLSQNWNRLTSDGANFVV